MLKEYQNQNLDGNKLQANSISKKVELWNTCNAVFNLLYSYWAPAWPQKRLGEFLRKFEKEGRTKNELKIIVGYLLWSHRQSKQRRFNCQQNYHLRFVVIISIPGESEFSNKFVKIKLLDKLVVAIFRDQTRFIGNYYWVLDGGYCWQ